MTAPDPFAIAAPVNECKRQCFRWFFSLINRRRSNETLANLTYEQLHDFDIPDDVRRTELARREWDVPASWQHHSRGL